jgi:archaellum component FlaF (FlaF/FlaG flagellin family)
MGYQLHKSTLLILFSTLLTSGILYFIQLPSIHLEVHGLQNANYLTMKESSVQNSNSNNNNNNTKPATANITNNGNIVEKASDKGMYRIQLRSNESFSSLPKKGFAY